MEDDLEPALTGDFNSGQRFAVLRDVPGDYYLVQDALGRAVASLPLQRGEIRTRAGRWRIGAERQRHGWAVVAHAAWDGGVVARASPSWRFAAYRLWFAPDWSSPRLKGSWFTGTWVLRDAGSRLARFKVRYLYGRSTNVPRRAGDRLEVGSIEIYEGLGRYPQLPLVILLALETIKAERAMVVPMWK